MRPGSGRNLKTSFTFGRRRRYSPTMLSLALAALAAASTTAPPPRPGLVRASGRATVVLLIAEKVPMSKAGDPRQRVRTLRLADGERKAILVEFE
jgi:hypothetical protein